MGNFTNKLKAMFRGNKEFNELKEKHGLNKNARIRTQRDVGHDIYVVRAIDNPRLIVHYEKPNYVLREAIVMACCWTWKTAQQFIKSTDQPLEFVHIEIAKEAFTKDEQQSPIADKLPKP